MFVSSYNTYIHTNSSTSTAKERSEKVRYTQSSLNLDISQNGVLKPKSGKNLPINYISSYKAFSNKQKLQNPLRDKSTITYNKIAIKKNAETAYEEGSKIFSLSKKPHIALSQTPKAESNLRHTMVNTYIANDRYYQISVA
ncbi:MAG: hypothetical protein J7L21_00410 [Sulfurimonas sp.]|nr:hypothetical protein [Sulfurimonas sp.]